MGQKAGDPHYLLMGTSTLITAHATGASKVSYGDFSPIASIFNDFVVLTVNPASPLKVGKDLVAKMKTEPQSLSLGFSGSAGNHHHIIAGLFMKAIGANPRDLKTVLFKGSSEAVTAILGGHLDLVSTGAGNAAHHMEAGKLRILAIGGSERDALAPEVPTLKESGIDLVAYGWNALFAPASMPAARVEALGAAIARVMASPALRKRFEDAQMTPVSGGPKETAAMLDAYRKQWEPVVKDSGITQ